MKVYVFVEGPADRLALETLWRGWCDRLRQARHGIAVIALGDKSRFFRKIGPHAAEKLVASQTDVVVGLPDLYPNAEYQNTEYKHDDLDELQAVEKRQVSHALREVYGISPSDALHLLDRFLPTALKHDLEMLLLAAKEDLRDYLGTTEQLGSWRHPVEDQNQGRPPKRIVQELLRTKRGYSYRDTVHAPAVLRKVEDMGRLLRNEHGQLQCPVFKSMLDWMAARTGVPAY
jgi:hypothetical protein